MYYYNGKWIVPRCASEWQSYWHIKKLAQNLCYGGFNDPLYTKEDFLEDYPIFTEKNEDIDPPTYISLVPDTILQVFIDMANEAVTQDCYGTSWRYAIGLFVAHYVYLYLLTYYDGSPTGDIGGVIGGGSSVGTLSKAQLGDSSIAYDTNSINQGNLGTWNLTIYGQQFVSLGNTFPYVAGHYFI